MILKWDILHKEYFFAYILMLMLFILPRSSVLRNFTLWKTVATTTPRWT